MFKIFKHDFLENYAPIVGIQVFLIFCWVFLSQKEGNVLVFLMANFFLFLGSGVLLVLIFAAAVRSTQQKLFGAEGYFTFSLPLSIDVILGAKIAVNLTWVLLSMVGFFLALFLAYLCHTKAPSLSDLSPQGLPYVLNALGLFLLFWLLLYLKLLLVLTLLNIGRFKRFAKLTGLVFFVGLSFVLSIPSQILQKFLLSPKNALLQDSYLAFYANYFFLDKTTTLLFLGLEFFKVGVLYATTRWLLVHKLALE
ncbi:hypothetical protein HHE02_11930 [Helicobacter heilmannii]|uniref:Conserved hypothetical membrane protein n=2 Tax=Helicobacter heilmannii TaxID=35817 RepID=A0A0K2XPC3_HELHE|nr:hypothetical protein [Helicobacter heilmannii]CCM12376.1 hypothetical protein BN341_7760 [Helicobacter heilmannii ASB1.4]CRF46525.1 hypothetical protein HHE014_15360 [Helicobacter heilmannii]CRF47892.1 hypothetical protein HHE02_11930 [Helicobacter heilmannii]CRF50439.1 hypothetical protein HHE06_02640 [Helicobacter heilmannii]CRI34479.1 conserved hypothetical membrane protein [Helicobacter heilmannii]